LSVNTTNANANVGFGGGSTIQIDGTGCELKTNQIGAYFRPAISVNNSFQSGGTSATFNGPLIYSNNVTFNSGGNYTLTLFRASTFSGTVDLTSAEHIITCAANSNITGALNLGSGVLNTNLIQTTTGTLTISGTLSTGSGSGHILNASSTNNIVLSGAVTGSSILNLQGAGQITVTGAAKAFSGSINVDSGELYLGDRTGTSNLLPSASNIGLSSSASLWLDCSAATTYTNTMPVSGFGNFYVTSSNTTGNITFPSGFFSSYDNSSASDGFGPYANSVVDSSLSLHEFPNKVFFRGNDQAGASAIAAIYYINTSASPQTFTSSFIFDTIAGAAIGTTCRLYANGTSALTLSGNFTSRNVSSYVDLRGTNSGDNTISGVIGPGLLVRKFDTGKWILSGNNTSNLPVVVGPASAVGGTLVITGNNTAFTDITITNGTLRVTSGSALGRTNNIADVITIDADGLLEISGGINVLKNSSPTTITGRASNAYSISTLDGDNTLTTGTISFTTTDPTINTESGSSLTIPSALIAGSARAFVKTGAGTLSLGNIANTFGLTATSNVQIRQGTIQVTKLTNSAGSLGQSTRAIDFGLSGTTNDAGLKHTGTSLDSCNRAFNFNSNANSTFTIDSSGTGSGGFSYSGTITVPQTGAHTLVLTGTNSVTNTISSTIPDSAATGATAITKSGSNTWSLTGTISATGLVSCTAGTLNLGSTNRTFNGGLSISGGTVTITSGNTISANTTISAGTTLSAVLTGSSKTLTITSGATDVSPVVLQPDDSTNGKNSFTGNSTINGTVDLVSPSSLDISSSGRGLILGESNTVTVSSTGTIRTKYSANQKGSARYYRLDLQAGSKLKIGLAA